jgi:hypothetical protein
MSVVKCRKCAEVDDSKKTVLIEKRLELLRRFQDALHRWVKSEAGAEHQDEVRSFINRNLVAARSAVLEAGAMKLVSIGPPPAIGGAIMHNLDPFQNLFENFYGMSLISAAMDSIDQAIGVYEHLQSEDGLVTLMSKEAIDIEASVERALRPSFRSGPPNSEKDVQDAVENIIRTLGLDFTRDREVTPVGAKAFRPDFIVTALDLAIEVKLAKVGHGAAEIQEEIAADIAAYRTKWRHLLIVIYDLGAIHDPYQLRKSNLKLFGVSVVVIKH